MIHFERVSLVYENGVCPLHGIDLRIEPAEFVFIIGSTGSGKSTLLKLIYRELIPSAGRVYVGGQDLSRIRRSRLPALRRQVGVVFQDFRLLPLKTVWENIAFVLQATGWSGREIRQRIPEALDLVGMNHRATSYPTELSGGEQQRVCIARAIVNRPPILLADEPTGNLDPATSAGIMQTLARVNESGTTLVVATHDQTTVDDMRRRVVALESAQIVRDEWAGAYHAPQYA
ncbi:MAG TPA: cell division ATP-binding protein FtsE [Armatimonadota bacterium]|nr:cell division ATP-binding protein FtsE [Armatimonadota bacterium]